MGADLQDRRGAAAGAARVPRDLQHDLADRAPRVPQPGRISPTIAAGSFNRSLGQRRLQSGVPKTAGGTSTTAGLEGKFFVSSGFGGLAAGVGGASATRRRRPRD